MNLVAPGLAALSAVGFAVSTSLQHHANADLRRGPGAVGTVLILARRPRWVLAQVVALAAFALHASALHLGRLVIVQPVAVSGVVLAVPVRAALARRRPRRGELGTVALSAAGLALFLAAVDPQVSQPGGMVVAAEVTVIGVLGALAVAGWAGRLGGVGQATGFGVASGVLFGLTAGLVKLASAEVASATGPGGQLWALATTWPAWAVLVVGLSGVALNQRAYQAGPISASMPLLNVVDVLVAVAFGVLVLGELPAHHPFAVLGQAVAIVLMAVGLRRLGRHHALDDPGQTTCSPAPSRSPS